jgi:type 1 glutamine amidotransferase
MATRRDFVKSAVGSAALLPALRARAAQSETSRPAPKKKALFVYGGWEGHEPVKCRDLFVPWLEKTGFTVVVSDTQDPYADAALMKTVDLVVQIWTMGTIKKEALKGLLDAVKSGTGIAGWHGGLGDAYRLETEYEYMVGGNWVSHPGGIIDYDVQIVDHEDPITAGIGDFKLRTEQYFMHVNPNNKVLATTTFDAAHDPWIDGCTMPVAWKKVYGKGRVFYTSLGHTSDVFDTPEVLEITRRGILWAAESRFAATPNLVTPVYPRR